MHRIRSGGDLECVARAPILVASQLTEAMAEKINASPATQVLTSKRFYASHRALFKRIRKPVKVLERRIRRRARELPVINRIYRDLAPFADEVVVRPVASLLYSDRPEDLLLRELVVTRPVRVPAKLRNRVEQYVVPKRVYESVKSRAQIVYLTNPDFKERIRVYVPDACDAIQFQLNVQTLYSLHDIVHQIHKLSKARFTLPFNRTQAEDWYRVVKQKAEPRYVYNPFSREELRA